ncbi:MAG: hypothetical protein AB7Q42_07540 [Acidimicrobiia bacterium]
MGFQFDPNITGFISGAFNNVAVVEPGGLGTSNLVLDPTKQFNINVAWEITGPLAPLWIAALQTASPSWSIAAYAESVGPGPELLLTEEAVTVASAFDQLPDAWRWKHQLTVPANLLVEENPGPGGPSGVYKIVVTAFLNSVLGLAGFDIMGYAEGPVIKVEDPV